jgi:1-phosphofructokinase family hexose kinase
MRSQPIHVVGPNPALDRIELLEELRPAAVNRSVQVVTQAGGKSWIVARTIRRLGGEAAIYGFLAGYVGEIVRQSCREIGIIDHHISVAGETRTTLVLVDRSNGHSTVVNEPGPEITGDEATRLLSIVRTECRPGDFVVTTGSLPPAAPVSFHGDIVDIVRSAGAFPMVDSSGAPLAAAISHRPWLVKPNLAEFSEFVGRDLAVAPAASLVSEAIGFVRRHNIAHIVVTLDEDGSLYTDGKVAFMVRPPRVPVRNTTGCGDMLMAGLAFGLADGQPIIDALTLGTAAAAAGARRIEPDLDGWDEVVALRRQVVVERLDAPLLDPVAS